MPGLKYVSLDLHVHTPASSDFIHPTDAKAEAIAADIVAQAISKGLAGIAITDHNSGEWVDKIKAAAEGNQLAVFPGRDHNPSRIRGPHTGSF